MNEEKKTEEQCKHTHSARCRPNGLIVIDICKQCHKATVVHPEKDHDKERLAMALSRVEEYAAFIDEQMAFTADPTMTYGGGWEVQAERFFDEDIAHLKQTAVECGMWDLFTQSEIKSATWTIQCPKVCAREDADEGMEDCGQYVDVNGKPVWVQSGRVDWRIDPSKD